jgi:hypothetical protein
MKRITPALALSRWVLPPHGTPERAGIESIFGKTTCCDSLLDTIEKGYPCDLVETSLRERTRLLLKHDWGAKEIGISMQPLQATKREAKGSIYAA